jgi:hypothetical protein
MPPKLVIQLLVLLLLTHSLAGHDVFIHVRPIPETGQVSIRPFFDDGSDAAGDEVIIAQPITRTELARYRIPGNGWLFIKHPSEDVLVIYPGGPGHRAEVRLRGDPKAAATYAERKPDSPPPPAETENVATTRPPTTSAPAIPEAAEGSSLWPWMLGLVSIIAGGVAIHRRFNKGSDA